MEERNQGVVFSLGTSGVHGLRRGVSGATEGFGDGTKDSMQARMDPECIKRLDQLVLHWKIHVFGLGLTANRRLICSR